MKEINELRMKAAILILFIGVLCSIPYVIRWEDKPEIPQYDAVWRGHWNQTNVSAVMYKNGLILVPHDTIYGRTFHDPAYRMRVYYYPKTNQP